MKSLLKNRLPGLLIPNGELLLQEVTDPTQFLQALEHLPGARAGRCGGAINLPPGQEVVGKTDFDLFQPSTVIPSFTPHANFSGCPSREYSPAPSRRCECRYT